MKIKKIIAVLLTLIMVTAMLPTAFAEGETSSVEYIFKTAKNGGDWGNSSTLVSTNGESTATDYAEGRDWAYLGYTGRYSSNNAFLQINTSLLAVTSNKQWLALKIKAPEAGTYSVSASAYMLSNGTNNMEIYLVPMSAVLDAESSKTAADVFARTNTAIYGTVANNACSGYTEFQNGKLGAYDLTPYLVGKTSLYAQTAGNADCVLTDVKPVTVTDDIDEYVLFFAPNGTGSKNYIYVASFGLTKVEEDISAPTHVTLATSTSIEPNEIKVVGDTYTRGQSVTVTAEEIQGYTFRHWVRGTADNGEVVSKSSSYSFPLMTNTYLTAVYSEKTDDKIVEFYNGNGEYLETKTVVNNAVELPDTPALTGFKFLRWIVGKNGNESIVLDKDNVTADVTYAVAEFGDDETVKFSIHGESEAVVYDTSITRNSSDGEEKAWYRNGALVGYGTSYTF
ncbi:MAG: InlB B-repeat-containing protein, partial [Oscillospiraceae bacterium]|nr:InlB B-repeat-containing protein [Oscillospiraceae bacterium]